MGIKYYCYVVMLFLIIGCFAKYKTIDGRAQAINKLTSIENGRNLVFNICGQCHYNDSLKSFVGKKMEELPKFIGKIYSANITHSSLYGTINRYSDSEIAYLLKTGISNEGKYIPWMIRPNLAEEDINDIIIYLRSKDKPLDSFDTIIGKTKIKWIAKLGIELTQKPFKYTITKKPSEADAFNYGKYLVDNLACYHCHSERIQGLNYLYPEKSQGYMQGGMEFKMRGKLIYAPNLTPDSLTGIGSYNLPQFVKIMRMGILPRGEKLHLPMQKFPYLNDVQVKAIYIYLKNLPAKKHLVQRNVE